MVCIYCVEPTRVVNSRLQRRNNHIWRRRKCTICKSIFTTEELMELAGSIMVVHSDGTLTPFSRDRLFVTIYDSCKHRQAALDDSAALTQTIITKLLKRAGEGTLARNDIAHTAHVVLTRFDIAAATVYAAYHPI